MKKTIIKFIKMSIITVSIIAVVLLISYVIYTAQMLEAAL